VFAGCLTEKGGDDLRKATSERLTVVKLDVTNSDSIEKALELVKGLLPSGEGKLCNNYLCIAYLHS